jgi:hypothetical protein
MLHEAVTSSECLPSDDTILSEALIGKDLDRSDCHLVYGTTSEFAWNEWGGNTKPLSEGCVVVWTEFKPFNSRMQVQSLISWNVFSGIFFFLCQLNSQFAVSFTGGR